MWESIRSGLDILQQHLSTCGLDIILVDMLSTYLPLWIAQVKGAPQETYCFGTLHCALGLTVWCAGQIPVRGNMFSIILN